jgi:hypothetical protein
LQELLNQTILALGYNVRFAPFYVIIGMVVSVEQDGRLLGVVSGNAMNESITKASSGRTKSARR